MMYCRRTLLAVNEASWPRDVLLQDARQYVGNPNDGCIDVLSQDTANDEASWPTCVATIRRVGYEDN